MKINVNELKPGHIIDYRGRLWSMVKGETVKPGKGPAYLQAELRAITDGTKLNQRFNTSETVERVELDEIDHQFLYAEGDQLHCMSQENFEQIVLPRSLVGPAAAFLQAGMVVRVASHEGTPLSVRMPETVVCTVVEADPVLKGQTAASSYKPAILDNGLRILVPPHVEAGTKVVVMVETQAYVRRAES
jgi:elongation factor P